MEEPSTWFMKAMYVLIRLVGVKKLIPAYENMKESLRAELKSISESEYQF